MAGECCQIGSNFHGSGWRFQPEIELSAAFGQFPQQTINGEFGLAAASLDRALILGYRDFKWLAKDPDLRRLRKHPIFRVIQDKIRRMKVKIS